MTANIRAYKADMELTKHCMVAYGPEHNTDMLIYAAQMAGMVTSQIRDLSAHCAGTQFKQLLVLGHGTPSLCHHDRTL